MNNEFHFISVKEGYSKSVSRTNRKLYENIRERLRGFLSGTVVDVGNGGFFNYDLSGLDRVFAVDPVFVDGEDGKIIYVRGVSRDLHKIRSGSCDDVLMQFLLHHLTFEDAAACDEEILKSFKEARRVLADGGDIIVVEMTVNPFLELYERATYRLLRLSFRLLGKPMVLFYSSGRLRELLLKAGFADIELIEIGLGGSVDPMGCFAPGLVVLPECICPLKCHMLVAKKSCSGR